MTEIVPVRIDKETLDTLDLFVTLGFYKSRSEAIRELMKKGIEARDEVKELGRLVKATGSLDRAGKVDLSSLELERERF